MTRTSLFPEWSFLNLHATVVIFDGCVHVVASIAAVA